MKKQLLSLLFLTLSVLSIAQPANDFISNATNLGNLPTPGACSSGLQNGLPVTISNQSTVGATAQNPYYYITSCSGTSSSMANPALDVWYKFVATGTILNISVSGFVNVNIGLFEGTDTTLLVANGCSVGTGILTIPSITPGKNYYLKLSGNSNAETDNSFTLAIDNDIDCNDCIQQASLTINPLPVNGSYNQGQLVNFCYHVDKYSQQNTNWLHGVQLSFTGGWDLSTLQTIAPSRYLATSGNWNWYNSCTSTATGQTLGQGFYFETTNSNPGDNYGDGNAGSSTPFIVPSNQWNFCWNINVSSDLQLSNNLMVVIGTSADGESGSWNNAGCAGDDNYIFTAQRLPIDTCNGFAITKTSTNVTCNSANNGYAAVTPSGGTLPYTYSWNTSSTDSSINNLSNGNYNCLVTEATGCTIMNNFTITQPNPLNVNLTTTEAIGCLNDTAFINLNINGGTGPYTQQWNNGLNVVLSFFSFVHVINSDTTVIVQVTDNNSCQNSDTVDISLFPNAINYAASSGSTNVSCYGASNGSAWVTPSGGSLPYSYLWSDNSTDSIISNIASGNYMCELIDNNGCAIRSYFTISQPDSISVNITSLNPACFGYGDGSISLVLLGGTFPLFCDWSTGDNSTSINNLSAGIYTCTITDANNCINTISASLINPVLLTVTIIDTTSFPCSNDTLFLTTNVTGGSSNNSYLWDNSSTAPYAYYYLDGDSTITIEVVDQNNCQAFDTLIVHPSLGSLVGTFELIGSPAIPAGNILLLDAANPGQLFDTVAVFPVNTSNNTFSFPNLPQGNYIIIYRPTGQGLNSAYCYYGTNWEESIIYNLNCASNDTTHLYAWADSVGIGPGHVSGNVNQGNGFGNRLINNPTVTNMIGVFGARVVLYESTHTLPVSEFYTDINGFYEFNNLAIGSYRVLVDIPGLYIDSSYYINITATELNFTGLDFIADSNSVDIIYSSIGLVSHKDKAIPLSIIPNPSNGSFKISSVNDFTLISIKDLSGRIIKSIACKNELIHEVYLNELAQGIYIIELFKNNTTIGRERFIITK